MFSADKWNNSDRIFIIAFVILAVNVFCVVKSLKRCSGMRRFVTLFLVTVFFLNLFVCTTSTVVPRYYITVLIFALPVLGFYVESEHYALNRLTAGLVLTGCF